MRQLLQHRQKVPFLWRHRAEKKKKKRGVQGGSACRCPEVDAQTDQHMGGTENDKSARAVPDEMHGFAGVDLFILDGLRELVADEFTDGGAFATNGRHILQETFGDLPRVGCGVMPIPPDRCLVSCLPSLALQSFLHEAHPMKLSLPLRVWRQQDSVVQAMGNEDKSVLGALFLRVPSQ